MSDYKRLLSYIYAYPGGIKEKNVGFAKVEVREGQCVLNINLKGVYTDVPERFGVYIMVAGINKKYGLFKLGDVTVNNGTGVYEDYLNAMKINSSDYCVEDIKGIAVAKEDNRYYSMFSLWEDEDIVTGDTEFIKREVHKPLEIKSNGSVEESLKYEEIQECEKVSEDKVIFEAEQILENEQILEDEEMHECKTVLKEEIMQENLSVASEVIKELTATSEQLNKEDECNEYSEGLKDKKDDKECVLKGVEKMLTEGKCINVFEDEYYYDCIEVTPELLSQSELSEVVDDNSFLMHSFFNYKHILLGRVKQNEKHTRYVIGVPGMYCNRERFMASMFGFNSFKKAKREEYNNPYFGYWYQEF